MVCNGYTRSKLFMQNLQQTIICSCGLATDFTLLPPTWVIRVCSNGMECKIQRTYKHCKSTHPPAPVLLTAFSAGGFELGVQSTPVTACNMKRQGTPNMLQPHDYLLNNTDYARRATLFACGDEEDKATWCGTVSRLTHLQEWRELAT